MYTPLFTENASPEEVAKTSIQYVEHHLEEFSSDFVPIGWIVYLVLDDIEPKKALDMLGFAQVIDKAVMESISFDNNTQKVKALGIVSHFLQQTDFSFQNFSVKERALFVDTLLSYCEEEHQRLATTIAKQGLVSSVLQDETIADKVEALKEADSIAYQIAKAGRTNEEAVRFVNDMTGEELYRQYTLVKKQNSALHCETESHGSYIKK